jgi:hypothetical protein
MKSLRLLLPFLALSLYLQGAQAACIDRLRPELLRNAPQIEAQTQMDLRDMTPEALQQKGDSLAAQVPTYANNPSLAPDVPFLECQAQVYRQAASQKMASQGSSTSQQPSVQPSQNSKTIKESSRDTTAQSSYPVPPPHCVSLKVEGESIIAVNHCGMPIVGQFCFKGTAPMFNCNDQTGNAFGPLSANSEAMIATTTGVNPRKNRFMYDICNNDAADHSECRTRHP